MKPAAALSATTLLAVWPTLLPAAVVLTLTNPDSTTPHEIEVLPGETFQVAVNLEPQPSMVWMDFRLLAGCGGVLELTDVIIQPPWMSATVPFSPGPLGPASATILASLPMGFGPLNPPPTLATLDIRALSHAPMGNVSLNVTEVSWMESWFITEVPRAGAPGPAFTVRIVPEPGTGLLLLGGALLLMGRRRGRRGRRGWRC